jgi:hypothetical protein
LLHAQKVKDRNKKKPGWVDEVPQNTLVACATGNDLEAAKKAAINRVREQIASSISSKVQSTFTQNTKEEVNGSSRVWSEETESKTLIETQLAGALSGVSEAFASDMYWEKLATGKQISFNCCLLYPFSRKELDDFIAQFEINRLKIKQKREGLLQAYGRCKSLNDITTLSATIKQELGSADPLFSDLLKSFSGFLQKELGKPVPRIERENSSSLLVSFLTASGKRITVNPVYTVDASVLRYEPTMSNCDSVLFSSGELAGRRNVALNIEYQFKNKQVVETLYWTPENSAGGINLKDISMAEFKSKGVIELQFDVRGNEIAEVVSVSVIDSRGPRKLVPVAGNAMCRSGQNVMPFIPSDSSLENTEIFDRGRMYDVVFRFNTAGGELKEKTFYSVIMN